MTNRTQCPNCLTVYIITDEQYKKSKGKVRCGTCRQPFVATFLPDDEGASNQNDIPSIEEQSPKSAISDAASVSSRDLSQADANEDQQKSIDFDIAISSERDRSESSEKERPIFDFRSGLEVNMNSELTIDLDSNSEISLEADSLINQMDSLIDEKLSEHGQPTRISSEISADDSVRPVDDGVFHLGSKSKSSAFTRWFLTPLMMLVCLGLLLILLWQLWMRQSLPWIDQWLEQSQLIERSAPYLDPIKAELEQRFGYEFPERRDLPGLRLVSARVEPHPARPSTTLLKISLLNRSTIAQPFPWLELVLTDVDGRLVSRRTLSPNDYLHNNRVANSIGSNELRPVTIELLAFPRQAHGYELKIVER